VINENLHTLCLPLKQQRIFSVQSHSCKYKIYIQFHTLSTNTFANAMCSEYIIIFRSRYLILVYFFTLEITD